MSDTRVTTRGLDVVYGKSWTGESTRLRNWTDNGEFAWRVAIGWNGVLPMRFARKRDAEAAMRAIADMGDWVNDWERIVAERPKEIRQRMVEAMAW